MRREELEQQVWGMRPGTLSETVPVTVRSLRRKLQWSGSFPLETVRGVGWRLHALPEPTPSLPRFGSPYQPRPAVEAVLQELLDGGWPVVTLTGPGGVGKTRLAVAMAQTLPGPVIFVHVATDATADHIEQLVLTAAGIDADRLTALDDAALVLLDEVEGAWGAVRETVQAHPTVRFLLTSRRPLEVEGEAVCAVAPMPADEASRFLRHRLRASGAVGSPSDEAVARTVTLLDGLPLALELAASRPGSLDDLLPRLERGGFARGPEQERLEQTLSASIEPLSPELRGTLFALAVCGGSVDEEALEDWLGADAVPRARALATRSLIHHRDGGWSMLRITRSHVRGLDADWPAIEARFDAFLRLSMRRWRTEQYTEPQLTVRRLRALLGDVHEWLERAAVEDLPWAVWTLQRHYEMHGPRLGARRLVDLCLRRMAGHPLPRLMQVLQVGQLVQWPEVTAEHDVHVRVMDLCLRSFFAPETVSLEQADAVVAAVDRGDVLHHRAVHGRALVRWKQGQHDQAREELMEQLAATSHSVVLRSEVLRWLAVMSTDQGLAEARQYAIDSLEPAMRTGMPMLVSRSMWLRDMFLAEVDPRAGAEAALRHAEYIGPTLPRERVLILGFAGSLFAALGEDDRALPLLDQAASDASAWPSGPAAAVAAAVRLRRDDPSQMGAITSLDPAKVLKQRSDGSSCGELFLAYLHAEIRLYEARQQGREREELDLILAERSAELREDDEAFCRASHRLLQQRRAALD